MSDVERIWDQIKTISSDLAHNGRVISRKQAETLVTDICYRERADVPTKALKYLTNEMYALVEIYAQDLKSSSREKVAS